MNKDQWTVTGLILLLVLLEVGRSKTVRSWFKTLYSDFQAATVPMVGGLPPPIGTGSTNPKQYKKVQSPTPQGKCPNGFTKFFDQFGIAKCGQ